MACLILACGTAKDNQGESSGSESKKPKEELNAAIHLAEYLRSIPGLIVTGQGKNARVSIIGFSNEVEPLFTIDGQLVQGGLIHASEMVKAAEIKSVTVLKSPSETSAYGIRGSHGVIEIKLK